jgi:hypothetical protein
VRDRLFLLFLASAISHRPSAHAYGLWLAGGTMPFSRRYTAI